MAWRPWGKGMQQVSTSPTGKSYTGLKPDLRLTFQIIPQHMLGQTNKTSPTSLWSHSKNANPRIYRDHRISFLGVWKISTKLWKHHNLTRNRMEKYFVILYISLACEFQEVWLTPEFSHWSYFYASENTALYYIRSDLHLEPFIEVITFDWGKNQPQFSVAWICLNTQQKSEGWMWCKRVTMLKSKPYHQEQATP